VDEEAHEAPSGGRRQSRDLLHLLEAEYRMAPLV